MRTDCREINIGITEYDLEELKDVVYANLSFQWVFTADDGTLVKANFMSEDELKQREN